MKKEYNQIKGFFFMFVFSTCKEYESFVLLAHKLQKRKKIKKILFSGNLLTKTLKY